MPLIKLEIVWFCPWWKRLFIYNMFCPTPPPLKMEYAPEEKNPGNASDYVDLMKWNDELIHLGKLNVSPSESFQSNRII